MTVECFELRDLLLRPDLLLPPPVRIPRLAWEGRLTMLAAREKSGKSTLVRQAVSCLVTGGHFLAEPLESCHVLWICLDEPLGDLVRGLCEWEVTDHVTVMSERPTIEQLEQEILQRGIGLFVIDTFTEWAQGIRDANSATDVQPVLRALRDVCHRTKCSGLILHHTTKAGTGPAGSVQIGAGVDSTAVMEHRGELPTQRQITVQGRMGCSTFTLGWTRDGGYVLSRGEPTMEASVLHAVAVEPGLSLKQLRDAVKGANKDKTAVLASLLQRGLLIDTGDERGHQYCVAPHRRLSAGAPAKADHGSGQGPGTVAGKGDLAA